MDRRPLIGVIITDCHVDFQAELLRGIIAQAFRSGCDVAVIAPAHSFYVETVHKNAEKAIFDIMYSPRFDGFIFDRNAFYSTEIKDHIESQCAKTGKPIMLLDASDHKLFETTSADDCEAFESITDHLIEVHGKKKVYCLTGPKKNYNAEERLKGYMNSMKKHGLHFDKSYYSYGDFWMNESRAFAEKIVSGELERPDAIVCGNDISAISVTKVLMAGGISVPDDIAVTGYDASMDGYKFSPSITSYSRPNYQLGAEAFRRLYRIITGKICSKVPNDNGALRLGRSCGCCEEPQLRKNIQRSIQINSDFEGYLFNGDMLFDISNAQSISDFTERLDRYTFFLYKMRHMDVCLTKQYIDSLSGTYSDKLSFRFGDPMTVSLAKSSVQRHPDKETEFSSSDILPIFTQKHSHPAAYYISPLHYNNNFFGYSAVSFGKEPITYASLYLMWLNYVNISLEQLRLKSIAMNLASNTNKVLLYDDVTGLLNRSGLQQAFVDVFLNDHDARRNTVNFISIELNGLKKAYYQSGEEHSRKIFASVAKALNECARKGEICGAWSSITLILMTFEHARESEVFSRLCMMMRDSQCRGEDSFNIDFSLGHYSVPLTSDISLEESVHKAIISKTNTYSVTDSVANPQFEKLCVLRSRIMKNPEMPWNISEIADQLYLSKSYLQKIYKGYFNKSIIEEMIEFRIEKAKGLLVQTELTVTEIARECGYSSYNYFVRQFRASEGISPSEYRDKHISNP